MLEEVMAAIGNVIDQNGSHTVKVNEVLQLDIEVEDGVADVTFFKRDPYSAEGIETDASFETADSEEMRCELANVLASIA